MDSWTIGWNSINMAIWLILNSSLKQTCLLNFETKFYEEWVSKLNNKTGTELTWYLLQALIFSRPCAEGVIKVH